jgi:hypothetical protein
VLQQIFNPYSFSLTHSLLILYLLVGTNRRLCYLVLNDDVWLIYESFSYTILNNVVADLSFGQVVRTFSQCVANVFSCGSQFSIAFSSLEHVDLSQLCVTECKKNICMRKTCNFEVMFYSTFQQQRLLIVQIGLVSSLASKLR